MFDQNFKPRKGRLPDGWENLSLQGKIALLDPRMKEWLKVYTETSNATAATMATYPNMSKKAAMSYSSRVKKKPLIVAIVREMGSKVGLTKGTILTALHEEIFIKENKTPSERAIRLNAVDKLCKIMGWYDDEKGVQQMTGLPQIIDYKRGEELITVNEGDNGRADEAPQVSEDDTGE